MADARTRVALLALCLVGLALGGGAYLKAHRAAATPITITTDAPPIEPGQTQPGQTEPVPADAKPSLIFVHVAGRVKHPSLYTLLPGSRLMQAVKAAGGPTADADLDAVNLAEPVVDGEKVYIPSRTKPTATVIVRPGNRIGHSSFIPRPVTVAALPALPVPTLSLIPIHHSSGSPISSPTRATPPPSTETDTEDPTEDPASSKQSSSRETDTPHTSKLKSPEEGQININSATLEDLERLPGIGPAMAARILAYREESGPFRKLDDLREVKGIGDKKLAKMAPYLTF